MKTLRLLLLLFCAAVLPAAAVTNNDGTINTANYAAPTATEVTNWTTGWGNSTDATGWNYVGALTTSNGISSGVYIGNGWVIATAHDGTTLTSFNLNSTNYTPVTSSIVMLTNSVSTNPADLILFQITGSVTLPNLTLATTLPVGYNATTSSPGTSTVFIGDGSPSRSETWGTGNVNQAGTSITLGNFTSNDFTLVSSDTGAPGTANNTYTLATGDSGGASFVYDSSSLRWELAGINEFVANSSTGGPMASGFVQLNSYAGQIDEVSGIPEPSTWALLLGGLPLAVAAGRFARRNRAGVPRL